MLNGWFAARTLEQHLRAGDHAGALAILDGALELQPEDPELLEQRARVLAALGRASEACAAFIKLGAQFADRGFGMRAIALLKQAQALAPGSAEIGKLIDDTAALAHLDDVAESPLFSRFSREQLVGIVRQLRPLWFEPGEILLMQGKPGNSLYVIAAGEVRVFAEDRHGRPVQVSKIPAPAFFGEIAVIRGGPRTATVTAATAVTVLQLTAAGLEAITASQPRVRDLLVEFADRRAAELQHQGLHDGAGR